MPTSSFRSSVSTFSSTTVSLPSSGVYSSPVPQHSSIPFKWYAPFIRCICRTRRLGFLVCNAGYPRLEKFMPSLSSASLHP